MPRLSALLLLAALALPLLAEDKKPEPAEPPLNTPPKGFTALFNGKNLDNWQIAIPINERHKYKTPDDLKKAITAANKKHLGHWTIDKGILSYDGKGFSLQTAKDYGNFELLLDWKIEKKGDSGLYLRGNPQVQIWDSESLAKNNKDYNKGSGSLWNNQKHPNQPLKKADKPVGQWNTFRIIMKGDKVTVYLNGIKVVDETPLENYWQRGKPLPKTGPIELQHHGDKLWFRNIYIKELPD